MTKTTSYDIARNKELSYRLFDKAWNENDMALLDAMVAPDSIDHSPFRDDTVRGSENFKHVVGMFRAALEGIHLTIEDEIAEEDRVVHRWVLRGKHTGELFGVPPTGREVSMRGMTIVRMENGKVVERWANMDQLGLLRQLGAIP
jgi:steroid delta-isomerase-like uncharacterized protein